MVYYTVLNCHACINCPTIIFHGNGNKTLALGSGPCCGVAPSIWNGNIGSWECSECGSNIIYKGLVDELFILPVGHLKETKCDCGGEKAKTTHANWCSKGNR